MTDTSRLAVCPGSFDPLTNGHLDMITRATRLFDRVAVAVLTNPGKHPLFTIGERVAMVRQCVSGIADAHRIEVDTFDGLLADYVQRRQAVGVVRGLRSTAEFSEEAQMAMMNRHLNVGCETVFLVPSPDVAFISSRLVREIASLGGSLDGLVPPAVATALAERRASYPPIRV